VGERPVWHDGYMEYLRNTWYVAMWSADLAPGQLEARTICEQPVVLFRRTDGTAAAIVDQCAHRFAPLSRGRLCGDHVECPYHGLRYDDTGACVENPHGSGKITPALHIASFPIVEKHSIVWIWMGDETPDEQLIPDFSHLDEGAPGVLSKRDHMILDVDYRLMVDNLLDLSHVNYLHDGILGSAALAKEPVELVIDERADALYVTRSQYNIAPSAMFNMMYRNDGEPVDKWAEMRWNAPGVLVNNAGVCPPGGRRDEGMTVIGNHLLTPIDGRRCYYHIAAVRIGGPAPAETDEGIAVQLSQLRRFAFEEQDRPMVEAQQRAYDRAGGPDKLKPVMLSIDSGPLRARRILERLIADEQTGSGEPLGRVRRREPVAGG
jgi:phenylpropionate dioxygenase-like ring-hydroxylating dioxygenase large terminal subunit